MEFRELRKQILKHIYEIINVDKRVAKNYSFYRSRKAILIESCKRM